MADRRLLSSVLLGSMALACFTPGKFWFPTIEGHVVDAATGLPVSRAEVFVVYATPGYFSGPSRFEGSATTNAEGAFKVPGHFGNIIDPPLYSVDKYPGFEVYHRDYGRAIRVWPFDEVPWSWRDVRIAIRPHPPSLEDAKDPDRWDNLCVGMPRGSCKRVCEVIYGPRCLRGEIHE